MKVVLDTNCFISCIGKKSSYRVVFDAFLQNAYTLCLSSEIILEYEEKFSEFWGTDVTANLLGTLLTAPNTSFHSIYYNFLLVTGDADDNKFADVYLAAGADILVSNDNLLLRLGNNIFPPVNVVTLQKFAALLTGPAFWWSRSLITFTKDLIL